MNIHTSPFFDCKSQGFENKQPEPEPEDTSVSAHHNNYALPFEILTTIFKMIHSDLVSGSEYSDDDEEEIFDDEEETSVDLKELSDDQIASTSLFPYSISAVCRYWDGVMSSFPAFWTRIVVWIDQPGHLERLKSSLYRSKSLELHSIWVVRSSEDNSLVDPLEKNKIKDVLCALSGRCLPETLVIRTLTTDAFPECDIYASNIRTLRLESRQRGLHETPLNPLPLSIPSVYSSDLSFLSLTGPIFVYLWRNEKWRSALEDECLKSLTIAHLRGEDGGEVPFTFQELWNSFRTMGQIKHLSWVNIDIPYRLNSESTSLIYHDEKMYTYSFSFDTVSASVLRAFYDHLRVFVYYETRLWQLELQKFHNCSFYAAEPSTVYFTFPFSERIEVSGISNPDALSSFFQIVNTNTLRICDCPGLDDASMGALVSELPFWRYGRTTAIYFMCSLEIQNCPNFSVHALREFVEFRNNLQKEKSQDARWEPESRGPKIARLSLAGSCPHLSEEENKWFKENVDEFVNESFV